MTVIEIATAFALQATELEAGLPGPTPDSRLFIYTGICDGAYQFQDPSTTNRKSATAALPLWQVHHRIFDSNATQALVAFCGLASLHTNLEGSPDFEWSVEAARAVIGSDGKLWLVVELASQGRFFDPDFFEDPLGFDQYFTDPEYHGPLQKIAYQVNVATNAKTVWSP